MNSIGGILNSFFPRGCTDIQILSEGDNPEVKPWGKDWMPLWPPDLFAFCATFLELTGGYACGEFFSGERDLFQFNSERQVQKIMNCARDWDWLLSSLRHKQRSWESRWKRVVEKHLLPRWRSLIEYKDISFDALRRRRMDGSSVPSFGFLQCASNALWLLAICDETCRGVGCRTVSECLSRFKQSPIQPGDIGDITTVTFIHALEQNQIAHRRGKTIVRTMYERGALIRQPFISLCMDVPVSVATVQPKTCTPKLGCSLRSLTHHLSLLPGDQRVTTVWIPRVKDRSSETDGTSRRSEALNLLLVPYPFQITGKCFRPNDNSHGTIERAGRFFDVHQHWLTRPGRETTTWTRRFFRFVDALIDEAEKEVDHVHGIVLPELSLNMDAAGELAQKLAGLDDLEFFITGATNLQDSMKSPRVPLSKHGVYSAFFDSQEVLWAYFQGKHHRWMLDRFQIERYHLGDKLSPEHSWWESLDVRDRTCHFYAFREHMSLTTLVCEDLARAEPVQPVVRSVGPNLMIVLLMDGPQLERRWPSRYATIYADDPGTSVLTLTCRGMVNRSITPGTSPPTQIALWRDCSKPDATELHLPANAQALLLSLSANGTSQITLDGRVISDAPKRMSLTGAFAIRTNVESP